MKQYSFVFYTGLIKLDNEMIGDVLYQFIKESRNELKNNPNLNLIHYLNHKSENYFDNEFRDDLSVYYDDSDLSDWKAYDDICERVSKKITEILKEHYETIINIILSKGREYYVEDLRYIKIIHIVE